MTTIETLPYRLNLDYFFIYLTVVLLFIFFAAFVRLKRSNQIVFSYSAVSRLFSPAELSFYHILKQAFSPDYEIFGKVRIADVMRPEKKLNQRLHRIALNESIVLCFLRFSIITGLSVTLAMPVQSGAIIGMLKRKETPA